MSVTIAPATLKFLKKLSKNNSREWFTENKSIYQTALANYKEFMLSVQDELSKHDEIEAMKVFRIYRDVRFSKDKTPYKTHLAGSFKRATKWKRGGMYVGVGATEHNVGGGFWNPEPKDLARIRQEIAADDKEFRKIISAKSFKTMFGDLHGEQVKSAPRGFKKDHPSIDLLKYKQFLMMRSFTDKEVQDAGFAKEVSKTFKAMRPMFNYMSDILTTDENGVRIE